MQLRSVLAVFVGGALGTAARALLQDAVPEWWLLFAVNALGSALLGIAVATLTGSPAWVRHGVGAGFLGGFTTFSAVAVASVSATASSGGWATVVPALPGIALAVGMLAVSLLGAWAGLAIGRRLRHRIRPRRGGVA
ncbi:CrcB family protein [Agrococcus sp. Marseille-P2731]|uniref:CrcB family protein n=1 Tax=Agrococcus sp. Marseille-P2731 TaxID=1841862 RepID=UPI00093156E0|nr:CrcB family protein [Agrococcus sp. Marseille-P2731]